MKPSSTILGRIGVCFIMLFLASRSYSQTTIISYGSPRKYLDNNTRPAGWETSAFSDAGWTVGPIKIWITIQNPAHTIWTVTAME
jgi:hypothetical protein